jgi:hypothetical protein
MISVNNGKLSHDQNPSGLRRYNVFDCNGQPMAISERHYLRQYATKSTSWSGYAGIGGLFFSHETVNHSAGEYRRNAVHTNGIESVWALLKRGIYGTWHHISAKHTGRYVNEVTFRLNAGNVANHTLARLDSFIRAVDGQRLTYKRLTA